MDGLTQTRDVIAVDLPGFGDTPPLAGATSIYTLADAVTAFTKAEGLAGVDMVGSSMGARLVLELARRGEAGAVVSLDPGGFWNDAEKPLFEVSIWASIRLVRALQPVIPAVTASAVGRTALFPQFSARPWRLSPRATLDEMRDYARATRFDELLHSLAHGPEQEGMTASPERPLVIGWGRRDHVCLPGQAKKATALFPRARLHWFDSCGHFPHWDRPEETIGLILDATA